MRNLIILICLFCPLFTFADSRQNKIDNNARKIRKARYIACYIASIEQKEHIKNKYIHNSQDIVARCATYMTLVYAFESNY
jgi:hypothetical protein